MTGSEIKAILKSAKVGKVVKESQLNFGKKRDNEYQKLEVKVCILFWMLLLKYAINNNFKFLHRPTLTSG